MIKMRATGIVRRVDDLGRVVIPKEIRRAMGIREGDPLEIYTTENGIVFKRYRPELTRDIQTMREKCFETVWGTHPQKAHELNELFDQIIGIVKDSEDEDDELKIP
jgi:stage V sporulation protein T